MRAVSINHEHLIVHLKLSYTASEYSKVKEWKKSRPVVKEEN